MKTFEYKIFNLTFDKSIFDKLEFITFRDEHFIAKLNEIGKMGWEISYLDFETLVSFYKTNYGWRNNNWTPPVFPILCKREL